MLVKLDSECKISARVSRLYNINGTKHSMHHIEAFAI